MVVYNQIHDMTQFRELGVPEFPKYKITYRHIRKYCMYT